MVTESNPRSTASIQQSKGIKTKLVKQLINLQMVSASSPRPTTSIQQSKGIKTKLVRQLINQGWALCSFPFGTLHSFPF